MAVDIVALVAAGSVVGGVVGLATARIAWTDRDMPGATPFGLVMVAVSGWCFSAAAVLLAGSPLEAYVFERLVRIASTNVVPLALVFVLAYAGHGEWLTPKVIALLWLYPTAYVLLSLTAPWHGFASTPAEVTLQTVGGVTAPIVPEDLVASGHLLLSYVFILVTHAVLFRMLRRIRAVHRKQTAVIMVGMGLPVLSHTVFQFGPSLHPGIDLTPVTFVMSGLVIWWALFHHDFLSVTPLASDVLVDELPDPVFVLDEDGHVVDHNPTAATTFDAATITGEHVSDVAPGLTETLDGGEVYSLPEDCDDELPRFYDPQLSALDDQHGRRRGRLIVLRDVTGQRRRQNRLEALQTATQRFIAATTPEEIAQLTVDFIERALDRHAAGVFLIDDSETELRPVAVTESVGERYDEETLVFGSDSVPYGAYRREEQHTVTADDDSPFLDFTFIPLGEHGVLAVGSRTGGDFPTEDRQFATILARSTQVALTQVERERELRQSRAAVERRSEQIEFFNGVLRHTLRNALLVIQGRADHLRDHVDDPRERHLDRIVQWCDDIADLNEEIREINDTVTATETRQFDEVDLTSMIRSSAATIRADSADVEVTVDVEEDLWVHANDVARRAVDSIVQNAVTHNDADRPRVEITTQRAAHRVQVRVADNGPGMSDELKETVFERNVAASQTSRGFGLYFVSVLMNLYDGTVWFEDNHPRGTVAVLEFQVADAGARESQGTSQLE